MFYFIFKLINFARMKLTDRRKKMGSKKIKILSFLSFIVDF